VLRGAAEAAPPQYGLIFDEIVEPCVGNCLRTNDSFPQLSRMARMNTNVPEMSSSGTIKGMPVRSFA